MNLIACIAPRRSIPVLLAAGLTACATLPNIPPVTMSTSAVFLPGKFVWRDLLTEDVDGVEAFYGGLLGWKFRTTEAPNYTLILHQGEPIGGIVDMAALRPGAHASQWVSLLSVPDVDAAVSATKHAGGEVHVAPVNLPGRGRLAVVSDPQGALVAYLRASGGDPPDEPAPVGGWLWTELWTKERDASSAFYADLVGYELKERKILGDIVYPVFLKNDVPRAGLVENPFPEVRTHWLPYVRVEDPAALAKRAEELGGKIILAPDADARKGSVAVVVDPSGAALALQRWTPEDAERARKRGGRR